MFDENLTITLFKKKCDCTHWDNKKSNIFQSSEVTYYQNRFYRINWFKIKQFLNGEEATINA